MKDMMIGLLAGPVDARPVSTQLRLEIRTSSRAVAGPNQRRGRNSQRRGFRVEAP